MGDIHLDHPLPQPLQRRQEMTGLDDRSVNEAREIAGNENEEFGCVAEAVIAQRQPGNDVMRDMIEKDHPQPDASEKIEPEVALDRYLVLFGHDHPLQVS